MRQGAHVEGRDPVEVHGVSFQGASAGRSDFVCDSPSPPPSWRSPPERGRTSSGDIMPNRSLALALFAALSLSFSLACGSDSKDGNGSSSSSGTSCSSQTDSKESFLCINDRCKCSSESGNSYPYTRDEAKQKCGSSTTTGNCPPSSSGGTSGGTSSGSSGGTSSGGPDPEG